MQFVVKSKHIIHLLIHTPIHTFLQNSFIITNMIIFVIIEDKNPQNFNSLKIITIIYKNY